MPPRRRSAARRLGRPATAALMAVLALLPVGAPAQAPGPGPAAPPGAAPTGWSVAPLERVDQARVRAELHRILASEELRAAGRRRDATTALTAAWLHVQAWIGRQSPGVTRGVVAACLLVLLLVGAHVAWSVRSTLRGERRRGAPAAAAAEPRSPEEARAAAVAAAAAGDHAEAVRLLYHAALRALARAGVCDFVAGTADWTVVARCRSVPGVEAPLRGLVSRFQESRFGGRACGRAEYDECAGHLDAILRLQAQRAGDTRSREVAA